MFWGGYWRGRSCLWTYLYMYCSRSFSPMCWGGYWRGRNCLWTYLYRYWTRSFSSMCEGWYWRERSRLWTYLYRYCTRSFSSMCGGQYWKGRSCLWTSLYMDWTRSFSPVLCVEEDTGGEGTVCGPTSIDTGLRAFLLCVKDGTGWGRSWLWTYLYRYCTRSFSSMCGGQYWRGRSCLWT